MALPPVLLVAVRRVLPNPLLFGHTFLAATVRFNRSTVRFTIIGVVLDSFRLNLELRRVRRVPDPILLGYGRFADMIHADRVIDILHVAPAIWSAIF